MLHDTYMQPFCHKQTLVACNRFVMQHVGWLVGCFGLNGPLRQYFSLYRAVSQLVGRPDAGSLPSTIAPPDHPLCNMFSDVDTCCMNNSCNTGQHVNPSASINTLLLL